MLIMMTQISLSSLLALRELNVIIFFLFILE